MAITRRAEAGLVEPASIHHGSLDTVANQVVGVVMDEGDVHARTVYETITSAYPFADLTEATFQEVVRELSGNRLLWLDEESDTLSTSGGTWQYFYANLSMIPDESTYEVYDLSSRRGIGTLDERFVVNFAGPGETFIQRGEMWRITEIDEEEERVEVTPIDDPTGEVPSWIGQEIPVPEPVAAEVGQIRRAVADALAAGSTPEAVASDLAERYPVDERTVAAAVEPIVDHVEAGHPVPTDEQVVIEASARTVAVNATVGHAVNETLARLLAALVGQRTGSSVGMDVGPYRVEFEVPGGVGPSAFRAVLETTDPDGLAAYLEIALGNADALKFTLAQVAAKFGAVKRYREGRGRFGGDRLLAALEDTPVYEEALREVFHADLAVEETADLLAAIQAGDHGLATARERTPIGTAGRSAGTEFLVPENADADVIETVPRSRAARVSRVRIDADRRVEPVGRRDRRGDPCRTKRRRTRAAHEARTPRREPGADARKTGGDRDGSPWRRPAQRRPDHQSTARRRDRVLPRRVAPGAGVRPDEVVLGLIGRSHAASIASPVDERPVIVCCPEMYVSNDCYRTRIVGNGHDPSTLLDGACGMCHDPVAADILAD
jgi:ATP-dependent Lhr-like helicase